MTEAPLTPRLKQIHTTTAQATCPNLCAASGRLDQALACTVFTAMFVFSGWTLIHHLATFVGIPWGKLVAWAWVWCPAVLALALIAGFRLSIAYLGQIPCAYRVEGEPTAPPLCVRSAAWLAAGIGLLALAAAAVALFAHRSDFDDAEYLQLAMQTISHPQLAPHTFDASLGHLLSQIRFSPYRIASYETLVAWVSTVTALPVMSVYYLLLPAISAALSIFVAYCFLRWFVSPPWAVLGLVLFLLISLAWGETHTAYGNRYLVRLFQGKGLIVAITTPLCFIMGLMLLRRPSSMAWLGLTLAHIASLGVSSSGVVTSIVVTAILFILAVGNERPFNPKGLLFKGTLLGASLFYTLGIALWLRFASAAGGLTPEIGTVLPITTSLGGTLRLVLTFVILALGAWAVSYPCLRPERLSTALNSPHHPSYSEYVLLLAGCLLIALNPLVADFFALISARNMTWRLAWAAPVLLLLVLSLTYICRSTWGRTANPSHAPSKNCFQAIVTTPGVVLAVALTIAFLLAGRWVVAPGNGVHWGWPAPKVPPEYHQAVALNHALMQHPASLTGTILVEPRVGTWLTVVNPQLRLVMPGHGYPVTLGTILPKQEHQARVELLEFVTPHSAIPAPSDEALARNLAQFNVTVIVDLNGKKSNIDGFRSQLTNAGYKNVISPDIAMMYSK